MQSGCLIRLHDPALAAEWLLTPMEAHRRGGPHGPQNTAGPGASRGSIPAPGWVPAEFFDRTKVEGWSFTCGLDRHMLCAMWRRLGASQRSVVEVRTLAAQKYNEKN